MGAPPTPPAPASPPPIPAPAARKPEPQDLLHVVPMRLAVSSVVANPAYSPFDLVDHDLVTAWNARTGEAKPWIAFRVPPGTRVELVSLTVGFTRKGAEGDYFTMNPRIKKVRVWHDKVSLREVTLDPESREFQDVRIDGNGGDYRIEVVETVPGTRKDWREVCVSELMVLGQPPPGMQPRDDLQVLVGSLDGTALVDTSLSVEPLLSYKSQAELCTQMTAYASAESPPCGEIRADHHPPLPSQLPAGWKRARWIGVENRGGHEGNCALAIDTADGKLAAIENLWNCSEYGRDPDLRFEATMQAGWFALVATSVTTEPGDSRRVLTDTLWLCGADRDGAPACIHPIAIGGFVAGAPRGYNCCSQVYEPGSSWDVHYHVAGDVLTLAQDGNEPDPETAKLLGPHRLKR
jgi:hypothetical protein